MSGHSHWSKIKWQKTTTDAKKGQAFSKMAREISLTAKEGGSDPQFNSKLRLAVDKARSINMPTDNIERAIKRGTGEIEGVILEKITLDAYGPGGVAIVIEGITDNKNRTLNEIKQVLNQNNGKLANEGSVRWMFERRGCIVVNYKSQTEYFRNKDELELRVIEAGAEDIYWENDIMNIYTKIEDLESVKKNLEQRGIKTELISLDWVAKELIKIDEKTGAACEKLFKLLDENETVQEIYSNLKI